MRAIGAIAVVGEGAHAERWSELISVAGLTLGKVAIDEVSSLSLWDFDLILEAAGDDPDTCSAALAMISTVVASTVVIATTTGTVPVGRLARAVADPGRFAGFHASPILVSSELVEIVPGELTRPETIERLQSAAELLGRAAIVVKDRPGFLLHRLAMPYLNQAVQACDDGIASAEDIDVAVRLGLGYPVGPLHLLDTAGLDVYTAVAATIGAAHDDPHLSPPPVLARMVDAGKTGVAVGAGFFTHPPTDAAQEALDGIRTIVHRYFDAVNDRRFDDLVSGFAEEAVLITPGGTFTGRAAIRSVYEAFARRFVSSRDEPHDVIPSGTVRDGLAAVTINGSAVTSAGEERHFLAADDFVIRDGLITLLRITFDTRELA